MNHHRLKPSVTQVHNTAAVLNLPRVKKLRERAGMYVYAKNIKVGYGGFIYVYNTFTCSSCHIHIARNRDWERCSLNWHKSKQWVIVPVPVLDQCEHLYMVIHYKVPVSVPVSCIVNKL